MGRLDWSFWPRPDRRSRGPVSGRRGSRKGREFQRREVNHGWLLAEPLEERTLLATLAASAPVPGGLVGTYFDNIDFTNPPNLANFPVTRVDAQVDFDLQGTASPVAGMVGNTFSVNWDGYIQPEFSETYTISINHNDGARVFVNNQLLIDQWANVPNGTTVEHGATITLSAGELYAIHVDYRENAGNAVAQLSWSSPSQLKELIPSTRLYHDAIGTVTGDVTSVPEGAGISLSSSLTAVNYAWSVTKDGVPYGTGGALEFDGGNTYVEVPNSPSLNPTRQLTVAGWFKVDSLSNLWQSIFFKGQTPDSSTFDSRQYGLWVNRAGFLYFSSTPSDRIGVGEVVLGSPSGLVVPGVWYNFAAVINADANFMGIYLNGQLVAQAGYSASGIAPNTAPLRFGNSNAAGFQFKGELDGIQVWNVARSQAEIQGGMTAPPAGNEANLVGYWQFEEPVGSTTVLDKSAGGNNGAFVGGVIRVGSYQATTDPHAASYRFVPRDNGTYAVSLTATDPSSGAVVDVLNKAINVTNVRPAVSIVAPNLTSAEGSTVSFSTVVTDPGAVDTDTFAWSVTRNGSPFATATGATPSFFFASAGTYVVSVTGTDKDGATDTDSTTLTVYSVAPTVSSTGPAAPSVNGLLGTYYNNYDFTALVGTRVDSTVNFNFGNGSPDPSIGVDTFSITWDGFIKPLVTGTYTISIEHDDGARVWINDVLLIDQLADAAPIKHGTTLDLVAGQYYPIRIAYRENGQGARAILRWQRAGQAEEVIPASQLFAPPVSGSTVTTYEGNPWTAFVTLKDPSTDSISVSVDYGDATPTQLMTANGRGFALSHVYQNSGDYNVTITLTDPDGERTTTSLANSIGYSGVVLGDNPIGYWRLGEALGATAVDATGHGPGGAITGAVQQGAAGALPGDSNTSYDMNGGAIALSLSTINLAPGGVNTVEFWMDWDGTSSIMPFGFASYDLWFSGGAFGFNTGQGDIWGISSVGLANRWIHVVAQFTNGDPRSNRLFLDGVEQPLRQQFGTSIPRTASIAAQISGWPTDANYHFQSRLDEVAVYNTALGAATIAAHYAASRPLKAHIGPQATMIAPANVNEGSSFVVSLTNPVDAPGNLSSLQYAFDTGSGYGPAGPGNSITIPTTDQGVINVRAKVINRDGVATEYTAAVAVQNVAPTLTVSGVSALDEGDTYVLNLASSDPGADTISGWSINWGDGNIQPVTGNPSSVTHVYTNGSNAYIIQATATDEDGTYSAMAQASPGGDALYSNKVMLGGPSIGYWRLGESSGTVAQNSANGSAPGTYVGNVGFGVPGVQSSGVHFNGTSTAVTTQLSLSGLAAFTLEAWFRTTGFEPARTGLVGQNDVIEVGFINNATLQVWTPVTGTLSVAYTRPVGEWTHIVAIGTGTQTQLYINGQLAGTLNHSAVTSYGTSGDKLRIGGAGIFDASGNFFNGDMDEVAVYSRALSASEVADHYSAGRGLRVTVANVQPTVSAGVDVTVDQDPDREGATFDGAGSFSDPGADTWTATVDYGDGSGQVPLALNANKTFNLHHVYAANGTYTVLVRVGDGTAVGSDTLTYTVNNPAPVLGLPANSFTVVKTDTLTFTARAAESGPNPLVAPVSDLTFSLIGAPTGATINPSSGVFTWTPSGSDPSGVYTFKVRVTDPGNPVLTEQTVVVTTTSAGLVGGNLVVLGDPGSTVVVDARTPASTVAKLNSATVFAGAIPTGGRIIVRVYTGANTVTVLGNTDATLYGGAGSDTLYGGGGNDTLYGGGQSVLVGGLGHNLLVGIAGGNDLAQESADADFTLSDGNLDAPALPGGGAIDDDLTNVTHVRLVGGPGANHFAVTGWSGSATLEGGVGPDVYDVTLTGSGSGAVAVSDSGATGADSLTVRGLASANALALSASQVSRSNPGGSESVGYTGVETLAILSAGPQAYAGPVVLGTSTTLDTGSSDLTLSGTVNGAFALTVRSAGTTTFGGAVGGTTPLGSLAIEAGGTTALNGGAITTAGAQAYGDAVTLGANTTLSSTGGNISFASTVNGGSTLTVNTAGVTTFSGPVGAGVALVSLTTDTGGSTVLGGGTIVTTGAQSYGDAAALGSSMSLSSNGDISFASSLAGGFALSVNTPGVTTFSGPVGVGTPLASLTTNAGGSTVLSGGTVATAGAQTYSDAVTLGADMTLSSSGNDDIRFKSSVSGGFALAVNTSGVTTFSGPVGAGQALASLTTDAGGATALDGGTVATTGAQSYGDAVTLGADTTLSSSGGGNIRFAATLVGAFSLAVDTAGETKFGGAVGTTGPALVSVTTNTGGSTLIGGGAVATTGAQSYGDAVTLGANTTLSASGGNISFASTLDGAFTLAVNTTGVTSFGGAVGGSTALTSLATNAGGSTSIGGGSVATLGAQSYGDAVTLGANATLTSGGGNISFASTLDGAVTLAVNTTGVTTFTGAVGAGAPLTLLSTNAGGSTVIAGGSVATTGAQSYGDAVTLGADTTPSSSGGGDISFATTVNGAFGLTINTSGVTTFNGAVGGGTRLASLTTDAAGSTAIAGSSVATTGAQSYGDAVTLGANTTLSSSGSGNINLAAALDGGFTLAVNTTGVTTFSGAVGGGTPLTSLSTNAGGSAVLRGGTVATTGAQSYGDAVSLGADTTLGSGADIGFATTVDGGFGLTVNTPGVTTFSGAVGGSTALVSLTTDSGGSTMLGGGTVRTTAAQWYRDAVTLGADATLSAGGNISFATTVDGGSTLTVNTSGVTTFGGPVGGGTPLASLTTNAGGSTVVAGGSVATTGAQSYGDAVTLGATSTLSSSGSGGISFASAVDGEFALTVNTSGVTTFSGPVGGSTALVSLSTNAGGGTVVAGGSVATAGAQSYGDAVTLGGDAAVSAGGDISFAATVNGGFGLTVNTPGTTTFSGAVGGVMPLASLTTDVVGKTSIGGGSVATTGAQSYGDAVTLGANSTLTSSGGGDIGFTTTVNGGVSLTINTSGVTSFGGAVGGVTSLVSLTTNAGGSTALAGGSIATTGAQAYGDAVTLGANTTLSSGGGTISLASTVNGGFALAVNTSGTTTFGGAVGGATPLTSLITNAGGTTVLGGGGVTTSGLQAYHDAVSLAAAAVLTSDGGGVCFAAAVDGSSNLTVAAGTGSVVFSGAVGSSVRLGALAVTSAANLSEAAGIKAASFTQTAGTGTTSLNGAVDVNTPAGVALTTQTIAVNAAILASISGRVAFTNAGALTIAAAGTITAAGAVTQTGGGTVATAANIVTSGGNVNIADPLTLAGPLTISTAGGAVSVLGTVVGGAGTDLTINAGAGDVTFAKTIDGAFSLTVNSAGTTTFNGAIGATTPLVKVVTDVPGSTNIGAAINTTGDTTLGGSSYVTDNVTIIDDGRSSTGIEFLGTVDSRNGTHSLTVISNRPKVFHGAVGSQSALSSLTTDAANPNLPAAPTQLNGGAVRTTAEQSYRDAVTLGAASTTLASGGDVHFARTLDGSSSLAVNAAGITTFDAAVGGSTALISLTTDAAGSTVMNAGRVTTAAEQVYNDSVTLDSPTDFRAGTSLSTNGGIKQPAGSTAALTVTGGENTTTIDMRQAEVPITFQFEATRTGVEPTLYGGKVSNTFIKGEGQNFAATFVGGVGGSQNFFDIVPSSDLTMVDQGGYNTIDLSHAKVGITLDLTLVGGQAQHVYQEALSNPNVEMRFDPDTVADLRDDSVSLRGRFQKVIGTSDSTFFASSASTSLGTDPMSPGSFIALTGTNNKVFAAPGATIQAFGDGNQVIQKVSTQQAAGQNAFLASMQSSAAAQQAFVLQNPARISAYLVGTSNSPASYIVSRTAAVGAYLATSNAGRDAFVLGNNAAISQFIAANTAAQVAYVSSRPAALVAYLSATRAGQSAFLGTDTAGLSAFVAGDTELATDFAADSTAGFSAYLLTDEDARKAFLADPKNGAARDASDLQAYLLANPTVVAAYLQRSGSALEGFLQSSPEGLEAFLKGSTATRDAYVVQNKAGISAFISGSKAAQEAFLLPNKSAVAAYIVGSRTTQQAYIAANTAGFSAFLLTDKAAREAFLAATPAAQSAPDLEAFLLANKTVIQGYVASNQAALVQFLLSSPTALEDYLGGSAAGREAYVVQNKAGLAAYVTGNPVIREAFLAQSKAGLAAFLAGDDATQQAFVKANTAGITAFVLGNQATLQAFLTNDPGASEAYVTGRLPGLQAYMLANPGAIEQYVAANRPILAQFLLSSQAGLTGFLLGSQAARDAYVVQNKAAIAAYIIGDGTQRNAFVAANRAGITAYLVNDPSALADLVANESGAYAAYGTGGAAGAARVSDYLVANSAKVDAYVTSSKTALDQYLTSSSAILVQYITGKLAVLEQFLVNSKTALEQYVLDNPSAIEQFILGSPTALVQFVSSSPDLLPAYLGLASSFLHEYVAANPSALEQFLVDVKNEGLLQQYMSKPEVLEQFLLASPTVVEQFVSRNSGALEAYLMNSKGILEQFISDNPALLEQFLADNPDALGVYLGGNSAAIVQYLTADPLALQQYLLLNPDALQQFLIDNPAILQDYLATNPGLKKDLLNTAVLDLFRLKVNMPGSGNQAIGGFLSTFNMGQNSLFSERIDAGQLQLLNQAVTSNTPLDGYRLRVSMQGGDNVVSGGLMGSFAAGSGDDRFVIQDPSLLGLASGTAVNAAILQYGGTFSGGGGNDAVLITGGGSGNKFGHVTLNQEATAGNHTLDFSNYQAGSVNLNLTQLGEQQVTTGNLWLTLPTGYGFKTVVGSPASDTITGNGLGNVLMDAAPRLNHPTELAAPTAPRTTVQWVYLDFEHPQIADGITRSKSLDTQGRYTAADQQAVLAGLQAVYAAFSSTIKFSLTPPNSAQAPGGNYVTVKFNVTPLDENGVAQPGGHSSEIDFGNLNLKTDVLVDINGFLGEGPGKVPDTLDAFRNLSITVAAHEVGHTLGLQHEEAFGPIGYGITNPPGLDKYLPTYPGPIGAFGTAIDLMASPASVGSTLADAAAGIRMGERDAVKLAFIWGGTSVDGTNTAPHNSFATAQPISLYSLNVPNPLVVGYDAGKTFDVAAVSVKGQIRPGTQTVVDKHGQTLYQSLTDYYSFQGQAGDLLNFEVLSAALTRFQNPIDPVIKILGPDGKPIPYYHGDAVNDDAFEAPDSAIVDLVLPATGTYVIQINAFQADATQAFFLDPNDPNYNPSAYYGTDTGDYAVFMYRFAAFNPTSGNDTMTGGVGNDTFVVSTGTDVVNGGGGTNKVEETGPTNFTLSGNQLVGLGTASLANIQQASLTDTGGAVRSFTINSTWTGAATLYGMGGVNKLNAPTALAGQIKVDSDLAQVAVGQDVTGSLSTRNVGTVSVGGTVAGPVTTTGNVGTLSVGQNVTAPVTISGSLITANIGQTLSGQLSVGGNLTTLNVGQGIASLVAVGGNLGTATVGQGLSGSVVVAGNVSSMTLNSGMTGLVAVGGNLGTASGSSRQGGLVVNGGIRGGEVVVLGSTLGDVTVNGGLQTGRIAVAGSVGGHMNINGLLDGRSALVVLGSIGNAATNAVLTIGNLQGIVAAGSTINAKIGNTKQALFYKASVPTNSPSWAAMTAVLDTGTTPRSFGPAPQFQGLAQVVSKLNALGVTGGELKSGGTGSVNLVAAGTAGADASLSGRLVVANLVIYVDNANGEFDPEELDRVHDTIAALDALLAPYGITVVQVGVEDRDWANVEIAMADSSPLGGLAEGVLGTTTGDAAFTRIILIRGWDWYTGADPAGIGAGQFDFQTVLTHELGHALGLGHSADPASVMFPALATGQVKRSLSVEDVGVPEGNGDEGPQAVHALLGWSTPASFAGAAGAPGAVVASPMPAPASSPSRDGARGRRRTIGSVEVPQARLDRHSILVTVPLSSTRNVAVAMLPGRSARTRSIPSFEQHADLLRSGWSLDERDAALEQGVAELRRVSREGDDTGPALADTGSTAQKPDTSAGRAEAFAAANLGRWLALGLLAGGANSACVYVGSRSTLRRRVAFASNSCR